VIGVGNAALKPVLALLTRRLVLVTLGFFLLLSNILMVALATCVTSAFSFDGFWTYAGTAVVVWLVNWAGGRVADHVPALARG
jgi:uncharacterized membrane protein YvlD (DUF360 family)